MLSNEVQAFPPAERISWMPWGWMLAFLALIVLLGFPIAVAAFVLIYLKVQRKQAQS